MADKIYFDSQLLLPIQRAGTRSRPAVQQPQAASFDDMLSAAIECVIEAGQASTSYLQRRLKLGYARAARLVDEMEEMGVVGPFEGSKPRQVLMTRQQWLERNLNHDPSEEE